MTTTFHIAVPECEPFIGTTADDALEQWADAFVDADDELGLTFRDASAETVAEYVERVADAVGFSEPRVLMVTELVICETTEPADEAGLWWSIDRGDHFDTDAIATADLDALVAELDALDGTDVALTTDPHDDEIRARIATSDLPTVLAILGRPA